MRNNIDSPRFPQHIFDDVTIGQVHHFLLSLPCPSHMITNHFLWWTSLKSGLFFQTNFYFFKESLLILVFHLQYNEREASYAFVACRKRLMKWFCIYHGFWHSGFPQLPGRKEPSAWRMPPKRMKLKKGMAVFIPLCRSHWKNGATEFIESQMTCDKAHSAVSEAQSLRVCGLCASHISHAVLNHAINDIKAQKSSRALQSAAMAP